MNNHSIKQCSSVRFVVCFAQYVEIIYDFRYQELISESVRLNLKPTLVRFWFVNQPSIPKVS